MVNPSAPDVATERIGARWVSKLKWEKISTRGLSGVASAQRSTNGRFILTKGRGLDFWVGHDLKTNRAIRGISRKDFGKLTVLKRRSQEIIDNE